MTDAQTPKPKGKTNKQRQKEQEKAQRELRKQEEARERYETAKHSFIALLVHFPYFIRPKWETTVAALICCGGTKCCFFCCFAPLICMSLLLPIHPGWEQPLHYTWLCSRQARLGAQHQFFLT